MQRLSFWLYLGLVVLVTLSLFNDVDAAERRQGKNKKATNNNNKKNSRNSKQPLRSIKRLRGDAQGHEPSARNAPEPSAPEHHRSYDPHAHHRGHHGPKPQSQPQRTNPIAQVRTAVNADGLQCKDALGNTLQWSPGRPDLFKLVVGSLAGSPSDFQVVTASCPHGAFFDIRTCSCEIIPEDPIDKDQCHLYLPFDINLSDYSINRFHTLLEGGANVIVDRVSGAAAGSAAAARFSHNSFIHIPGRVKTTARMQFSSSFCAFFRCGDKPDSTECVHSGGLINNHLDARHVSISGVDSTFSIGIQAPNKIVAKLVYGEQPADINVLEAEFKPSAFVQVCVTHDSLRDKLFINKELATEKTSLGKMLPVSGPYTIGHSKSLGYFNGLIDEVLVCDHTMQHDEIAAHYEGNRLFFQSRGYIPQL